MSFELIESRKNYCIDSIRHPDEVAVFRPFGHFSFIEVYADPRIRFNRMLKRARENDPTTFEAFCELEKREAKNFSPNRGAVPLIVPAKVLFRYSLIAFVA